MHGSRDNQPNVQKSKIQSYSVEHRSSMEKLPCDLINIPGFEALQPSDDTDWEIDQLLSQVPDPAIVCLQIPYISEPPESFLPAPASTWSLEPTPSSQIREALQRRRNTEPQEARHPCKHPKEHLLCCQCMERVECMQKEDEPE